MLLRTKASLLALTLFASPVLADTPPLKQPGRWAQDYLGRAADPAIRFGTLPNGLRYAIMHNKTPSDGVAMRMRIGAGSLVERDEEQGLAHFLEHMAFRGSKNVADGEVVHMLERQGLRFGPDTNAFTAHDETVYMFTFPKADTTALDTGFTLFREIGERLTLAPAAIEAEKGVVLSEERLRDGPAYRAVKADYGQALAGTRAVTRWPIGLVETIKGANTERLRRYYSANYRPDNATLVVVGNIDPASIEAEIRARFADWKPAGKADAPANGTPVPASPTSEFVAEGAQDTLNLSWVRPLDRRAETEAIDREEILQRLGFTVLNNRLADRAAKPGAPYVGGSGWVNSSVFASATMTRIVLAAPPETWREALQAITDEQRQIAQQGVSADDLKRAVTQMLTHFQTEAAQASTRKNSDLADELIRAANEDRLASSPAQDLAFVEPLLASVTPGDVNEALRRSFAGKGPVLFRSAQKEAISSPVLEQALQADYARPLPRRVAESAIVWPYDSFGTPSAVVSQVEDKDLGTTTVTFGNGTRLLVKPTSFEKATVHVTAAFGHGRKGADPALVHALWAADLMTEGGTGKLPMGDINRWIQGSGKVISVRLTAATGAFRLTGTTRPQDLGSQLSLLAAFARDPGFRPELEQKIKAIAPMIAGQIDANAGAVFSREMQRVISGGEERYGLASAQDFATTKVADLPLLLRGALSGAADVTIVGDVSVADAIRATQASFGSGATTPLSAEPQVHITMAEGQAQPDIVTHAGRADQAFYGEFWSMPDYFADPKACHTADIVAALLQTRLVDTAREKLGLTYSPQAWASASTELPGQGYLGVMIETPQANFATFHALLAKQIEDLATHRVSADELERAKQPLIQARTKAFESNTFWNSELPLVLRDPRVKAPLLAQASGIKEVTAEDVQALMTRFITSKVPTTIISKAK
jgi:zinc protease